MKPVLKKVLYVLGIIVLLLLLAGIIIQVTLGGSIKSAIIKNINASINSELVVKGDIDFSVFRNFPYLSINFYDVALKGKKSFGNDDLLTAKEISLQFSILNIFRKNYIINRVKINDGKLTVRVNKTGDRNYFIFNSSSGNEKDSTKIKIDKIIINHLEIFYHDEQNNQDYALNIHSAKLSGNFSASRFSMNIATDMLIEKLDVNGIQYFKNKETNLALGLDVDLDNGIYKFNKSEIKINKSEFELDGNVKEEKDDFFIDLAVKGTKIGLGELGSLLPDEYNRNLVELDTRGDLAFTGTIKGPLSPTKNPFISFVFDVKKATLKHKPSGQKINNVSFTATYNNGAKHSWGSSVLKINHGEATFISKPFTIEMTLTQFNKPSLMLNVNGTVDLKSIAPFLGIDTKTELAGEVQLDNFSYRGLLNMMSNEKALVTQTEGSIKLVNASCKNESVNFSGINAFVISKPGHLELEQLSLKSGSSDISGSGEFANLFPFIITSLADSTYAPANAFSYNLNLSSNNLDTKDFKSNSLKSGSSASVFSLLIPCGAGKATISIKNLISEKFVAKDISSNITVKDKKIYFDNLSITALSGTLQAGGSIDMSAKSLVVLETTVNCKNIDINQLFTQFNNFDQETLTDKNLKGILNTQCYLKAYWRNGVFVPDDLTALADVTIDKGELNHFKPLYALSKFIKVKDLENIRFSKLANQIEIKKSTIIIPTTTIFTNALSLEMEGTHTFSNYINYKVKINFLQLLSGKFKSSNNFDPDATEKNAGGLLNLYVTMTGPGDNPTIKYDKHSVKTVIKNNLKQENKELKNILQKEFSKQHTQEEKVKDWAPPEKYELLDLGSDTTK